MNLRITTIDGSWIELTHLTPDEVDTAIKGLTNIGAPYWSQFTPPRGERFLVQHSQIARVDVTP